MKKTALAYSNIALIKYWGKVDFTNRLPANNSISMNLSNLKTITTVEFQPQLKKDDVLIDGAKVDKEIIRVKKHLDRIRKINNTLLFAKVVSQNNFPKSTGLSSSASGFAALTLAATSGLNLNLSENKLSHLARLASGSACRSIPGGFVEWYQSTSRHDSFAKTIFPDSYWNIVDFVAVVGGQKKDISTSFAQRSAFSSPFLKVRLKNLPSKLKYLKLAIEEKNFPVFGEIIEAEALEMHAIIMTQARPLIYFLPETLALFRQVRMWRLEGLLVFFTLNTGHDVHLFCQEKDKDILNKKLTLLPFVKRIIINYPAGKAAIINKHLF
ncbi:diphosphomevalonate decarboxylase [Candidatus Gottesmanbacteria bacterium RBG_16_37_8]|uniref:diphosphomevalonate decarboxylase n=1 Tax=Candidatus Gottesmanbacteria bacterium RBG_16_37_8 TaxID=1798371 RepID=A0A1F5YUM6_9BACT|nr:MAG: diphosphomevalonate decarboxylase [Candidatus Gottesmanbacteria bacterium RBG_16_37_8]